MSAWRRRLSALRLVSPALLAVLPAWAAAADDRPAMALGVFEAHGDVGDVGRKGSFVYDARAGSYTVTGGGANMWFATDAFHFVWKKAEGDVALSADVRFVGSGGNNHRKAALLVRQGLEPDAAYADAVVHGDGLTSIQYREERGGPTREIQSNVKGPARLRSRRRAITSSCRSRARASRCARPAARSRSASADPSCRARRVRSRRRGGETAVFSSVEIQAGPGKTTAEPTLESTLETIAIDSKDRRVVRTAAEHFEAPNWSRDGRELIYNSGGLALRDPGRGREPRRDRHRLRDEVQQRPRAVSRRHAARDLGRARRATASRASTCCPRAAARRGW